MTDSHPNPAEELDAIASEIVRRLEANRFLRFEDVLEGDTLKRVVALVRAGALAGRLESFSFSPKEDSWCPPLLVEAAGAGLESLARALLEIGADPNSGQAEGETPIETAAQGEHNAMVKLLLGAGADVNGFRTCSALHHACRKQDVALVAYLLEHGADPLCRSLGGQTPIQMRGLHGPLLPEIQQLLRQYAEPFLDKKKGSSLTLKRQKPMYVVGESFGASRIVGRYRDSDLHWSALAVRADLSCVTDWLEQQTEPSRVERGADRRFVGDAVAYEVVFQLKGAEWTLVTGDAGARIRIEAPYETAESMSRELCVDVVAIVVETVRKYVCGERSEQHEWSAEAATELAGNVDDEAVAREVSAYQEAFNNWLEAEQILIPPFEYASDGYFAGLRLWGLKKSDIAGADIIVRREFD